MTATAQYNMRRPALGTRIWIGVPTEHPSVTLRLGRAAVTRFLAHEMLGALVRAGCVAIRLFLLAGSAWWPAAHRRWPARLQVDCVHIRLRVSASMGSALL